MNSTLGANETSVSMDGQRFGYGIGLSLGVLISFVIIASAYYVCRRHYHEATSHNHRISSHRSAVDSDEDSITSGQGLDETTLSSYPQFTYSQLKAQKLGSNYASACSICLADYKDTDLLRTLPDCGHLFHLKCIDPWLMLHSTCPVCRDSLTPTPVVSMDTRVTG